MHPRILKHIIKNDGSHLQFCPAVLPNYTRHKVKGQSYPGAIPLSLAEPFVNRELTSLEKMVRGTFVSGLTKNDMKHLDYFEGNEYDLVEVQVHLLAPCVPLSEQTGDGDELIRLHTVPLPPTEDLAPPIQASTYVFKFVDSLEVDLWDFDEFVKKNASKWYDYGSDEE